MKMISVSGIVCYVKDINKTAEFYEVLGFQFSKREPGHVSIRLNWFWMDFHPQEAQQENKGAGQFLYIKIDSADEFYQDLVAKGLQPANKPKDWPWGNREFIVRDPDGYNLVFFQKL